LVDEEVKHFSIVEQMMKTDTCPELAKTDILKNAKNIFEKIKGKKLEFNFDLVQADFYRKAQEFEEKSYQHYLEMSDKVEDKTQKNLLLKLAEEEKSICFYLKIWLNLYPDPRHGLRMQNLIIWLNIKA